MIEFVAFGTMITIILIFLCISFIKGLSREKNVNKTTAENTTGETCATCDVESDNIVTVTYYDELFWGRHTIKEYDSGETTYCPFHGEPAWEYTSDMVTERAMKSDADREIEYVTLSQEHKACLNYLVEYYRSPQCNDVELKDDVSFLDELSKDSKNTHKVVNWVKEDILLLIYSAHEDSDWFTTTEHKQFLRSFWSSLYTDKTTADSYYHQPAYLTGVKNMLEEMFNVDLSTKNSDAKELFDTSPRPQSVIQCDEAHTVDTEATINKTTNEPVVEFN